MAIVTKTVFDGDRKAINKATSHGDAAAAGTVFVDASALTAGRTAVSFAIEEIWYSVQGFEYLKLEFDATTNVLINMLTGDGYMDFRQMGGLVDPRATGTTGDIIYETEAAGAGTDSFDITIVVRKKF